MKNAMLFLLVAIPVYVFTFLGYYAEGHDPKEITIMMGAATITALVLVEWMLFLFNKYK